MLLTIAILFAAADPAVPQPVPAADTKPKKTKICKTVVLTGSRLGGRRFCSPLLEWEEYERDMRDWSGELVDGFRTPPPGGFKPS